MGIPQQPRLGKENIFHNNHSGYEKQKDYVADPKLVNESKKKIVELIKTYKVEIIAIGNGTAGRETEAFIAEVIKENKLDAKYVMVSEAGASVYSASDIAIEEFPDLTV